MTRRGTTGLAQIERGMLPLALIQYPSGRWGFVGKVPAELAFTALDGGTPDPEQVKIACAFGPSLAKVKARTWATAEEARAEAEAAGHEVGQVSTNRAT